MPDSTHSFEDAAHPEYTAERRAFWDRMTAKKDTAPARYYHGRLHKVYRSIIPPGASVIEIGCGSGELLAALSPERGVGVDFSPEMLELARHRHPHLRFIEADAHDVQLSEKFDFVILSDLINDVWDVQRLLLNVTELCHPGTRIVLNTFNRLWQIPIAAARAIGFAQRMKKQNWLSLRDIENLMRTAGLEAISTSGEILWPIRTPLIAPFLNRFLVKLWPFNHLALTHFVIARPNPFRHGAAITPDASVSVIVPARNEAGHIEEILERTPRMGSRTEILLVEGNSTDDTLDVIREAVASRAHPDIRFYVQPGIGKGDAVRHGYDNATGEVLMILDADMTVAPEDLPRFYDAITSGTGEFINGVRLVYPMEDQAMQFLNLLGNKVFGIAFSWLLRQPVKDTLCGTKVLTRTSYDVIAANRSYFGDFDPFGDFDLLFGAAHASMKIVDMPIRYRQRRYGSTNISRWRHGVLLLRMAAFAARKLRFI